MTRVTLKDVAHSIMMGGLTCNYELQTDAADCCRTAQAVIDAAREAEEALQDNNSTYAIALLQIALAAHDKQEAKP